MEAVLSLGTQKRTGRDQSHDQSHCLGSLYFSFQILKEGRPPPRSATDLNFPPSLSTGSRIRHLEPLELHGAGAHAAAVHAERGRDADDGGEA